MNNVIIEYIQSSKVDEFATIKLHLEDNEDFCMEIDNHAFTNIYEYTEEVSSSAFEFYVLSILVYNIDKLIPRKKLSLDGWCREISFEFHVEDVNRWDNQKTNICAMLSFLSGDNWNIDFIGKDPKFTFFNAKNLTPNMFQFVPEKVCLFSGGLDSLVGAYQLLSSGTKTILVSHYDGMLHGPKHDQEAIRLKLPTKYKEEDFDYVYNRIGAKRGTNKNKLETTFRTRSILFLGMASYLAHNLTPEESFYIPENGTISLNLPLSPSRRSSCSTKTTHPHVLLSLNKIFSGLGINTSVENPFEFKTKGEMLELFKDDDFFKSLVSLSNSCGKSGHKRWWRLVERNKLYGEKNKPRHCGKCMPCMYRRAALNKVGLDDVSDFGDNIFETDHWQWLNTDKHKRFKDVKTFLRFVAANKAKAEIKKELLINGSLPMEYLGDYANVVVRTIAELKQWMNDNSSSSNYTEIKNRAKL